MHELGIVFYILDGVREAVEQDRASEPGETRVSRVTLQLGEVSGVVPELLADAWRWAADREDLTRGAQLEVEEIPAETLCESCGEQFATIAHGRTCPVCGSARTHLLQGDEIILKQIELA